MKTLRILLLLSTLLSVSAAAQAQRANPVQPMAADRIVAVVNDEAVTLHELRSRMAVVTRQLKAQGTQLPAQEVLEKQLLERLIIDRIQLQMAKESGVRVDDMQLDASLRRIADSNQMSLADFRAALERDGIAWHKFREEVREEIILSRLREREVDNHIAISEGEIDNYLANQERNASSSDEVILGHILLRAPEQATPEELRRVRTRADQALQQLQRGDDFSKVAASFSDAPDALAGGVISLRPVDRLPGLYADAARKLKVGETSEVLRSAVGFHIVKLMDKRNTVKAAQAQRQTRARHILIKINELTPEAEAKRKAMMLKERLDNGADFAELARQYSADLSALKGGELGWLHEGDTVAEFESVMNGLKINEISPPVQSQFGWHLIQVLERRMESAPQVRQRLAARQALRDSKSDEAYQDWIRQIRDRAYVEYRLEDR